MIVICISAHWSMPVYSARQRLRLLRGSCASPLLAFILLDPELTFLDPTLPFPTSTLNPNKSTTFPFPKLTFAAAIFVKLCKLKNFCNPLCAVAAASTSSCCKIYKTATRAKSRTSSVMLNTPRGLYAADEVEVV